MSTEPKVCSACEGTKMLVPDCETCSGNGWVEDPRGGTMMCPDCDGAECEHCHGTGDEPEGDPDHG